jgi:hypothetical protein
MLMHQPQNLADPVAAIQDEQSGGVSSDLVPALRLEADDLLDLLRVERGKNLLLFLEPRDFEIDPLPFQVGIDASEPSG